VVAHACNPSYLGGRDRKFTLLGHPRQKGGETLSQNKLGVVVHICNPRCSEGRDGKIVV
jgi:hypothetical protein